MRLPEWEEEGVEEVQEVKGVVSTNVKKPGKCNKCVQIVKCGLS